MAFNSLQAVKKKGNPSAPELGTHRENWWFQPTPLKNDGLRQLG